MIKRFSANQHEEIVDYIFYKFDENNRSSDYDENEARELISDAINELEDQLLNV